MTGTCPGCTEGHLTDQHAPGDPTPDVDWSSMNITPPGETTATDEAAR